ncbi:hypothetical protein BT96DRAFT_1008704 [Gymnopus androsaceus JB14]|uniref:Uncharacterized protein n=1 Tax=Gymnopus androsaceus JB14 TaxID=1447944 RepID=A0A6A4GEA7_9AGAR|nr:hypothetical protein BT96DRAFT_1008704 [Gymnopus androsaceus JB14]
MVLDADGSTIAVLQRFPVFFAAFGVIHPSLAFILFVTALKDAIEDAIKDYRQSTLDEQVNTSHVLFKLKIASNFFLRRSEELNRQVSHLPSSMLYKSLDSRRMKRVIVRITVEIAVIKAVLERATIPGDFNALSKCMDRTMRAQRICHLEHMMGIERDNTCLLELLTTTHIRLFNEQLVVWSTKPIIKFGEVPEGFKSDNLPPLKIPRLTLPDWDAQLEHHAFWATVGFSNRTATAKKNFIKFFIELTAIPFFYEQKLTQLDIAREATLDFKGSVSLFETLDSVVTHLAECGVTVEDMATSYYWAQQYIWDMTISLDRNSDRYNVPGAMDTTAKTRQRQRGDHWRFAKREPLRVTQSGQTPVTQLFLRLTRRINLEGEGVTGMDILGNYVLFKENQGNQGMQEDDRELMNVVA